MLLPICFSFNTKSLFLIPQHEDVAMPYVQLLADFRDEIRNVAREEKGKTCFI